MKKTGLNGLSKKVGYKTKFVIRKGGEGVSSYDTQDFELAVSLLAQGYELIAMHPIGDCRRVLFHFVITSDIEYRVRDYYDGVLLVDAERYWDQFEALRACLHEVIRHEG